MYVTRAWCLWELYCSISNRNLITGTADADTAVGVVIQYLIPEHEKPRFMETLRKDDKSLVNYLTSIDVENNASASKDEDLAMILETIRDTVGYSSLDKLVLDHLRGWYAQTALDAVSGIDDASASYEAGRTLNDVAFLLNEQV